MNSVRAAGVGPDLLPDWLRQRALSYYATNVWLVTREALRRKPYQLWAALRDAALVPGQPRGYSEPSNGAVTWLGLGLEISNPNPNPNPSPNPNPNPNQVTAPLSGSE